MEKRVIYCDICGKENAYHYSFPVDTEMDGAGDRDDIYERFDLCADCTHAQLTNFLDALEWPVRKVVAQRILKEKKFYLQEVSRRQRYHGGYFNYPTEPAVYNG